MTSNWNFVVVLAGLVWCASADFGVPSIVLDSGSVGFNANQLRDSFNDVLSTSKRIPANLHSDVLRYGAGNISTLVLNMTEIGSKLANNLNKAAGERSVPVADVFGSLGTSVRDLEAFLLDGAQNILNHVNGSLKNVTASEIDDALEEINKSLMDVSQALNDLQLAMNKVLMAENAGTTTPIPGILDISNSFAQRLSKSLEKFRDQVKVLNKAVDATVKSIEVSNSFLDTINSNRRSVSDAFKTAESSLHSTVKNELSSITDKYLGAQKSFQQDYAEAVERLKIFTSNSTLNVLVDLTKEEYTKNYYQLYNRNSPDVAAFGDALNEISSNVSSVMNQTGQRFFDDLDSASSTVVDTIISRGSSAAQCSNKFSSRITGPIFGFHFEATNCVTRERGRIPRITETVDRLLQLVQSSSKDFTADLGSCSRFGGFAINEMEYDQAKGCLESNLRETGKFNQIIGAQLDVIKTILTVEADASIFRASQCMQQTASEESALLEGVRAGSLSCMANGI
nr:uncharacterized protein LOC109417622 [Aedes albopictus]